MYLAPRRSTLGHTSWTATVLILLVTNAPALASEPSIVAIPPVALYGEPFSWRVSGLEPGENVTVTASIVDARKMRWSSQALFQADATGSVDLSRQAPLSGSYSGIDGMGLLWSMTAATRDPKKPIAFRDDGVNGWTVMLKATPASGEPVTTEFRCVWQRPGAGLVRVPLEQEGLRGFLYYPEEPGRYPGIIIVGGSEGGLFEPRARALASHGYAVLTLAYFGYPGLRPELVEVPLEIFDKAAAWLQSHPRVEPGGLGILGGSKGAEAALLAASRNASFKAVAALAPTSHVWEGQSFSTFFSATYQPSSSWSVGGKPLPYLRFELTAAEKEKYQRGELLRWDPYFRRAVARATREALDAAAIPVERIQGAVLLISGTDDEVWPSEESCSRIVTRLRRLGFEHEVEHVSLAKGGHASCLPAVVTANRGLSIDGEPVGGSPQADAHAGYQSWAATLAFFHEHLAH